MHNQTSVLAACTALFAVATAFAGTIRFDKYNGPGLDPDHPSTPPTIALGAANNDDPPGKSPRTVNNFGKTFANTSPIDMLFRVDNSRGTTEYLFDENVTNRSGVAWTDFHFALGFGTYDGATDKFVASTLADFLDFDCPNPNPAPSSTKFPDVTHRCNSIDFSGAPGVAANGSGAFSFSIDVPDAGLIPTAAQTRDNTDAVSGYTFTLRQYPTTARVDPPPSDFRQGEAIPEPSTVLLLAGGLGILLLRRRHQTR